MTIQCGDRALEDYRKKQDGVTAVSVALSAPPEKVGDAVLHMKEQMDQIRMKLNQMQASYLAGKLEEIKRIIGERIKSVAGIKALITLVGPGTIPRFEGKAKRVIDKRNL